MPSNTYTNRKKNESKPSKRNRSGGRRFFSLNIGTVIFGAIFLYLIITVILYLTARHITSYQVISGPLSKNDVYTAMVLRQEEVVTASDSGYVTYFVNDSSKVGKNQTVCGISSSPNLLDDISSASASSTELHQLENEFSRSYSGDSFQDVYDFKYDISESFLDESALNNVAGTLVASEKDGIVAFSTDGYETITQDNITEALFETSNYSKNNLRTNDSITAGAPVFRLITSESWSIVLPVTDKQTVRLASFSSIKVIFKKDGKSETGTLSLFKNGDQRYVKIDFTSGMVRYANDRYLDVELVTNTQSGLKIPLSSIVTKDFYLIPVTMETVGGEDGEVGFMKEITDEEGNKSLSFVEATLYSEVQDDDTETSYYYVDKNLFEEGDVIVQPDSNTRYTIRKTGSLQGVYSMNKGYAIFRKISVIDQNEEYCIIESGTTFGISQYDYIVQDGSQVNEEDILY